MRNLFVLALTFTMLMTGAGTVLAAEDNAASGGMDAIIELLQKKGVVSVEESAALRQRGLAGASQSDLKAVLELLLQKGVVSDEEASGVLNAQGPKPRQAAAEAQASGGATGEGAAPAAAGVDEDMLRAKLNLILVHQGILGDDEMEQIAERIGKKWSHADEDDVIAPAGGEIEFHSTTLPKEELLADIDELVQLRLIDGPEADRIKERFLKKTALEHVTYGIGAELRTELDKQVNAKIVPIPSWTSKIRFGGDFRLRYQLDLFDGEGGGYDSGNGIFVKPDKPTELYNSTIDRQQLRIRARLNAIAKVNDEFEVGLGLATGNSTNPVSTNATLGDSLNKKNFLLDLGYLKWTPSRELTLWGGRFGSPWFGSDLVWDPDVNFDGIAFTYRPQFSKELGGFLTGGVFPIQEVELSSHDKWLYGGQIGLQYKNEEKWSGALAAAYYYFDNTRGVANDPSQPGATDWTAPAFQQKGNTLFDIDPSSSIKTAYASAYHELNVGASLDLGFWDPLHLVLIADYVRNLGFNQKSVNALTGALVKKETQGYQLGVSLGHPDTREAGLWRTYVNYKRLEADAVMDAFTESDFHLGGTNAKGWILGGDLGVAKNVWFSGRWLTTNEISGPPLAIDLLQLNLNAKF